MARPAASATLRFACIVALLLVLALIVLAALRIGLGLGGCWACG